MNTNTRRIADSPVYQGATETIPYTLDTSPWPGATRASITMKVLDSGLNDVTSTIQSTAPSATGTDITFALHALTVGARYTVAITWTSGGGTYCAWGEWIGQT